MLLSKVFPTDIRVEKEARALAEAGHDVFVLSLAAPDRPDRETIDGYTVVRRSFDPSAAAEGFGVGEIEQKARILLFKVNSRWREAIDAFVAAEAIDVLHVHDLPLVKTAIVAGEQHDVAIVADLHENWPEAIRQYRWDDEWRSLLTLENAASRVFSPIWRLKRLERYAVTNADHVITVVDEARDHYVTDCGAPRQKVSVVSNVVDLEVFDEMAVEPVGFEDEFVLSYVGTLSGRHRGLKPVIEAVPMLRERIPNFRLLIVGSGDEYEQELKRLTGHLDVEDAVSFVGHVPFKEVASYIAASDLCLVPHRSTGHTETTVPHKLFQYMAMEKPVLVTDIAPLRRIVHETDSGVVVPPGDPDAVADATVTLYRDPARQRELGENGRNAVEQTYNWRTEARRLVDVYETLASDG